jgi:hypothetical protein
MGPLGPTLLSRLDIELVRRLVSRRAFAVALASKLRYVEPPAMSGGVVRAVLGDDSYGRGATVGVTLRAAEGAGALLGDCSGCSQMFGPCAHAAVVAVDLAASAELRDAMVAGGSTAAESERAPEVRAALNLELNFDGALGAWLGPAAEGERIEISASPDTDLVGYGRNYGERSDGASSPVLAVTVRRTGARKLFTAREIAPPTRFGPRDRRVLEHVRDHGYGRKAAHARGVDASLALEAMRLHAGIFGAGYKGLLDFRAALVRPAIVLCPAGTPGAESPFDALTAFWVVENDGVSIQFADSVFFAGPFSFVWTRSGAIYRVARDVDAEFARQLAQRPVLLVPPGKLRDAGSRLLRATRGHGVTLPAHEAFGLPPLETPRIVLRLVGEPLDVSGELVAVYRAREVKLSGIPAPQGAAALADGRDLDCEAQARAHIERAGLMRGEGEDDQDTAGPGDRHLAVSGEDAIAFWQTGLLGLRAAVNPAVDVELAERLARVRVGAPVSGRVHVVLEGNWLNTRLEFASSELPIELGAIRAALSRKRRWVTLSDGTLARISTSIEGLAEEASSVMESKTEARLPAHQLGRLDRWIEENDGRMDAAVGALRSRLRALAVAADPDLPKGLRGTLRPYQRLGLAWLQFLQVLGAGGILADDMGLGKTITTLAFLLARKEREGAAPSLVVCPTSVATNWVREAERFTPNLRVLLLHGPSRDARAVAKSDLVVTTYALLRRDIEALSAIPFRCAILDEAQNIKNSDGATTRAAGRLDATMRLALSGTPIENRLRELWSLSSFVNPGILGTVRAFETRFERPIATDRSSPLAAELRAIVRPFLLRRTKGEVLRELPPKVETDRVVTLTSADKRMYDALAHTLRESVAKALEKRVGGIGSLSVFTALTRLRQMACDPRLVDATLAPSTSAKRAAFLDLVRELSAEGRRALVFSQFVQLLTLWRRDLDSENIAYEYLDGQTTKRDEVVDRFQNGSAPLFLISLKAGGAGLNLTAADTVIHCDPWWNPAVEDQATDRAYRIGQDKPVTVVRLIASGTIEEKILSLKEKKRELTRAVIGDDARALEGITAEDLRMLLGDSEGEVDPEDEPPRAPATDKLATASRVLDPEFHALVAQAQQWLRTTGRLESDLATTVDIPVPYASRLARGEPFPCSRVVAERIRLRLREW